MITLFGQWSGQINPVSLYSPWLTEKLDAVVKTISTAIEETTMRQKLYDPLQCWHLTRIVVRCTRPLQCHSDQVLRSLTKPNTNNL
eukprot:7331242-Heterocapsa_arctica.AAC.1